MQCNPLITILRKRKNAICVTYYHCIWTGYPTQICSPVNTDRYKQYIVICSIVTSGLHCTACSIHLFSLRHTVYTMHALALLPTPPFTSENDPPSLLPFQHCQSDPKFCRNRQSRLTVWQHFPVHCPWLLWSRFIRKKKLGESCD